MTTHCSKTPGTAHAREVDATREAALKDMRRAERARTWLHRVQALACVVVLFVVLSAVKTWVPPITDRVIVIVIVFIGVFALISGEEGR